MILIDDDATAALLFNKKLLADYNLGNPYDYVHKNEWTYENFCSMWLGVGKDLNGDSKIDVGDQFGFIWQNDATIAFFHALGARIAAPDPEGVPEYILGSEACMNAFEAIAKYLYNTDLVINCHDYSSKYANIYHMLQDPIFTENRALFNWVRMRVVENYRNMDADFGIMPMPKYDSGQKNYYHTVNSNTCNTIEIPNSSGIDPDFSGFYHRGNERRIHIYIKRSLLRDKPRDENNARRREQGNAGYNLFDKSLRHRRNIQLGRSRGRGPQYNAAEARYFLITCQTI